MTALILAIIALILNTVGWMMVVLFPAVTIIMAIVGIILSVLAMKKGKEALAVDSSDTKSKVGRILGIVGLVYCILMLVVGIAWAVLWGTSGLVGMLATLY